jgi:hypothetical protein
MPCRKIAHHGPGQAKGRDVPILWSAARLYGTLGSVVLFLIWAYLISWILLLGGLLLAQPARARGVG